MKFSVGARSLQEILVLPETRTVTHQKTSRLLVINTEYLFAWIGQIKVLTLIVSEQLMRAICFLQAIERNHRGNQSTK